MPDPEAVVDTADDLRDTLSKAFENPDPAPAAPETPPPETPAEPVEASDDRPRDERGRFVKTAAEQAAEDAAKAKEEPAKAPDAKVEAPKVEDEHIAPPQNWKGAGKVDWNRLPKAVKQEILADYERFSQAQGKYQPLEQILEPRRQALTATYGSVENAVNQLFALSDYASQNPREFIQWFAQQRGIDLGQPASAEQAEVDPVIQPLQAKISQLEQTLNGFTTQFQQSQNSTYSREIEVFAADPKHPYFNDVRPLMATFLGNGQAKDLQEAYDMAVYANPSIRAQMLEQERQAQEEERRKKAEQAKAAAASVSGSPVPGASQGPEPSDDLRGFLVKQFQAARA